MNFVRCIFGGFLMGLANLVPGISGGTMLLAVGVYPKFIESIAEVTSLKLSKDNIMTLALIGISAVLSIAFLAGTLKVLVLEHRWIMYCIFIGLTLGGAPILKKLIGPWRSGLATSAVSGFVFMFAFSMIQFFVPIGSQSDEASFALLVIAGIAGASAMVLPGISGGFILLLLGCYVPILSGISLFKDAIKARSFTDLQGPLFDIVLPVGLGIVVGIVIVTHIVKWLLVRYEKKTYAFLFGVLLGAIFGLWPFQAPMPLDQVDLVKGQEVTLIENNLQYVDSNKIVKAKDIPMRSSLPSLPAAGGGLLLILLGYGATQLVDRLTRSAPVGKAT